MSDGPGEGAILFDALGYSLEVTIVIVVVGLLALLATSGKIVSLAFDLAHVDIETDEERDTGMVIGKMENVLVLILMLVEAYTALGVVFAAKSIVRRSDMSAGNTSYYLTGTITNFTYTILVGVVLHGLLWGMIVYDIGV